MPSSRRCRSNASAQRGAVLAALFAALFTFSTAAPAAETGAGPGGKEEPAKTGYSESVDVRLAMLEVVVVDRKGRHVRGLPRSAFRLEEGGREVPIVSFDEIDLVSAPQRSPSAEERIEEAQAEPAAEGTPAESPPPELLARQAVRSRLENPRWFAIVIDGYNNPSPLRISQVRRAAKKWIRERLRPTDRAAVYEMTPYLRSLCSFTSEVDVLDAAIDEARVFPASPMGREMITQRIEQGGAMRRDILEQQLLNAGRFGSDLLAAEREQFYLNIDDLARALGSVEGTKAVLLFSGGFPLTRTRTTNARGGFTTRFRRMLESLQDSGVRVFTFDVGVEGSFTDASVAQSVGDMLDQIGLGSEWLEQLQLGAQVDAANAHREIHVALAGETGGRFWRTRDYAAGLRAADDDLSHYYLLGFRPRKPREGRRAYLPIRVRLDRKGLRAITQHGRVLHERSRARRPAEKAAARAVAAESAAATPEPSAETAPRVSCQPLFFPAPRGRTLTLLPCRVAGLPAGEETGRLELGVTLSARLSDLEIARESRSVTADLDSRAAGALAGGLYFLDAMVLPPMELTLMTEVTASGSAAGRWRETLTIPARSTREFGLTDLVLIDDAPRALAVYDVFRSGAPIPGADPAAPPAIPLGERDGEPMPFVRAAPSAATGRPLPVFVQVVAPPPAAGPGAASPLQLDWELVPASGSEPLLPPVEYLMLSMRDGGTRLDVLARLDLAGVPAGDYTLRLTAADVPGGRKARAERPLHVGAASASSR